MNNKVLSGVFSLLWFAGVAALAGVRVAPHITPLTSPIQTFVLLENSGDARQVYTLKPFTIDGEALPEVSGTVAPFDRLTFSAAELGADVSHFTMETTEDLDLFLDYRDENSKQSVKVPAQHNKAASWTLQGTEANAENDALTVVNMGEHPTPVWLHQRDGAGDIVASSRLSYELAPGAKLLHVIDHTNFKSGGEYHYEVIGNQNLAVMALRGNTAGKLLVNETRPKRGAESMRDEVGVWYITDGSLSDVFEMMGYNVATDRMWQGELLRRTALGRLAEIFGETLVSQDSLVRITGYSIEEHQAAFEALSEEEQTVISSYADGFNRRIAELRSDPSLMPFEFLALGITDVENWTPVHILAWATTLQHQFTSSYGGAFQLNQLAELQDLTDRFGLITGSLMFLDLHWTNDTNALSMVPADPDQFSKNKSQVQLPVLKPGVPDVRELAMQIREQEAANRAALQELGIFFKGGSYAWVVSGEKTASGNPILYSGPQLENPDTFQAPGIVQEGSIQGGGINVSGLIVTGIPAIIVGRTPHHAWSFQVGHASDQDLYFDRPEDIISQRIETIHVAGGEDVQVPVVATVHGQVINADPLIAFKVASRHYEFGFLKATLGFARAQSMDEFDAAANELAISMHICYADVDKNIAYWHTGREPVRGPGNWYIPQGVVADPLEWDAAVIEPLVHDRNNPQGFYGGWNNKAHPNYDDPSGSFRFSALDRAHIITDYLSTHDNLTFDDVAALAPRVTTTLSTTNFAGNMWTYFGKPFRSVVEANPTEARLAALAEIDSWDGQAVTGSEADWPFSLDYEDAWVLQDTWLTNVIQMTLGDELSTPLYGGNLFRTRARMLHQLLDEENRVHKSYRWFRNVADGVAGKDAIILAALDRTLEQLGERPWGAGQRPLTVFAHPLFGDLTELVPSITTPFSNRANYAQCVEMGDNGPVQIGSHFVLGQSGHIGVDAQGMPVIDPSYFGMMPYFASFTLRPFPLFQ